MTARLRAICTVLLTVALLAQLFAGQLLMLVAPAWLVAKLPAYPDAVATPYMTFVRDHVPAGQVVVLRTSALDNSLYYRLSYVLAGRNRVYWLTEAPERRPPYWWSRTDGSAGDLASQARRFGATYVAFDGVDPPAGLQLAGIVTFAPGESLGRVQAP